MRRILALILGFACLHAAAQTPVPTGRPVPSLAPLDTIMQTAMARWNVPGGALAVAVDGRLVYARGFGYADRASRTAVQPNSLFRVASNSKSITATAILKLIEAGRLTAATQPFHTVFPDLLPNPVPDPRLLSITVQQLLEHKGGWDDTLPGIPDPAFGYARAAASAAGAMPPATPEALIRYMARQPLPHAPGTTYAYSNFGYILLGAVIARLSGQTYESFVRMEILAPGGLLHMQLGRTLPFQRRPDEVTYYDYPAAPLGASVFPPLGASVFPPLDTLTAMQYGAFSLELMQANAGWLGSPIDLVRFGAVMNGQLPQTILHPHASGFTQYVPPLGFGWDWGFAGALSGSNSILHLDTTPTMHGRVTWAATFNSRAGTPPLYQPVTDADQAIHNYLRTVTAWPGGDLFPLYH